MSRDQAHTVTVPTRTFVLGMVRPDGELRADELYRVADACGLSDQQVRLCLRRLVGEGALTHRAGRGRKATYDAPPARSAILPEFDYLSYAYRQDAGHEPWDGLWRIIAFSVPETHRSARDVLRVHVLYHGAAALYSGVYVSPHEIGAIVAAEAKRLDVADGLTLATCQDLTVGGESRPHDLAQRLWPIRRLKADYERFTSRLAQRLREMRHSSSTSQENLRGAFLTTFEFAQVMQADPLLPPELLPRPWAGANARALLAEAQADLFARQDLGDTSQLLKRLTLDRHPHT